MKSCTVCGKEHNRVAQTCSPSCAGVIASKGKARKAVDRIWDELKSKHVQAVKFPDTKPLTTKDNFNITCSIHGYVAVNLASWSRYKNACPKCGSDSTKNFVTDTHKQCSVCNEIKPHSDFDLDKGRLSFRCTDCRKQRDKQRGSEANRKQKLKINSDAFKKRKFEKGELFYSSSVKYNTCPGCGAITCKVGRTDTSQYCSKQCSKTNRKRSPNVLKETTCPSCGIKHQGKTIKSLCLSCRDERDKAGKKAVRNRYEYRLKIATTEIVIDRKVFDRDNWRCKYCNIKVQKVNIYADNAAEVDHIMPLSKGGAHNYSNVQTLCRKCNRIKSDNIEGQLVMSL